LELAGRGECGKARTMRISRVFVVMLASACGQPTPISDGGGGACVDTFRTPANLIENWSFECGAEKWGAVFGSFDVAAGEGRNGSAAGRLTVGSAGGRVAYVPPVATELGTRTFCATAWVKGTVPFIRVRLLRDFGGSVQEVQFNEQLSGEWKRTPPSNPLRLTGDNAPKLLLVFEAQTNRSDGQNAEPGQTLLIDDVDVWETSGTCAEVR
jgi:hypothetical protein